jgi:hypothetical protein
MGHPRYGEGKKNQDERWATRPDLLEAEGKTVVQALLKQGSRSADAVVDGVTTEFKTLAPGATSSTVRNVVNASIKRGGQARDIIIDARGSGLTQAEAARGLNRAGGIARGQLDNIRVIGNGFDISKKF